MWTKISHIILKHRLLFILFLGLFTGFMGFYARQVKTSFKFAELVPLSDPNMKEFMAFKETFGQDANIFLIGIDDLNLYDHKKFLEYQKLCTKIGEIQFDSLNNEIVVSKDTLTPIYSSYLNLCNVESYTPNKRKRRFDERAIFNGPVQSQEALDSLLAVVHNVKFYENYIYNKDGNATVILIGIKNEFVNSKLRQVVVDKIMTFCDEFEAKTDISVHYAGVPYIRSIMTSQLSKELTMFLFISLAVTALILLFFFRSFYAVLFPLIVIAIAVIWTMGTIVLLGYEISMLTGLIPPIIVVIGIPNCIYLLNKYHQSIRKTNNKMRSLSNVVRNIGIVTLITNTTTAIGFVVLVSADITILKEFGTVAGINVIATFIISIILIPAVFSYLPAPQEKQLSHLDFKIVSRFLLWLDNVVANHRSKVYWITGAIVIICSWGCWKVYAVSYMVDDIPEEHRVKKDLTFFEETFNGVMPLEIVISTNTKKPYTKLEILRKLDQFQNDLEKIPEVSKPFSIVNIIKGARQAYWGNNPDFYAVPTKQDKNFIYGLLKKTGGNGGGEIIKSLVDSTGRIRVSLKVKDLGSKKMDALIEEQIRPLADSYFKTTEGKIEYNYSITGTTLLFIRGINFLIQNLQQSLVIAVILIAFIMGLLFRNVKMIILSIATNIIPLLITGAFMGYMGIPLKPSTALIFSIAFGISVDDSIHFLAKYRQELFAQKFSVPKAVSLSIKETGASMIYTSIVLFGGFSIFTMSNFLGTQMLGLLTSTTLLCAMITNLVVLPSLLLTFDSGKRNQDAKQLIDSYHEETENDEQKNVD